LPKTFEKFTKSQTPRPQEGTHEACAPRSRLARACRVSLPVAEYRAVGDASRDHTAAIPPPPELVPPLLKTI